MDEWIEQHSTPDDRATRKTTKPPAKRAAKKTGARKAPAKKAAADVVPNRSAIGANPERRFPSGPSRGLADKR